MKLAMKIFLDTNVLLDVFQERQPYYDCSAQIWSLSENRTLEAFISAISFNNIFYIMRKHSGKENAQRAMEILDANFSMIPMDKEVMHKAIISQFPDFEDAIQLYSALSAKADCIVTRDIKDFAQNLIPVLSPQMFLAQLIE